MDVDLIGDSIANYLNGHMSPKEKADFEALMELHPELKAELILQQELAAAVRRLEREKLREQIRKHAALVDTAAASVAEPIGAYANARDTSEGESNGMRWMKIAASIVFLSVSAFLTYYWFNTKEADTQLAEMPKDTVITKKDLAQTNNDSVQNESEHFSYKNNFEVPCQELRLDNAFGFAEKAPIFINFKFVQLLDSALHGRAEYTYSNSEFTFFAKDDRLSKRMGSLIEINAIENSTGVGPNAYQRFIKIINVTNGNIEPWEETPDFIGPMLVMGDRYFPIIADGKRRELVELSKKLGQRMDSLLKAQNKSTQ